MADTPNATKPAATPPASNDQLAKLLARLDELEAKVAKQEEEVVEENPTYAPEKDSATKSRYPEATKDVYEKLGLANAEGGYADTDKVKDMLGDDLPEGAEVTSYRVRAINDDIVVSYTLSGAPEAKGVYYPNK